jgi:hypothetical protein
MVIVASWSSAALLLHEGITMRRMARFAVVLTMSLVPAGLAQAGSIGSVFYIAMENHNWTQPGSQGSPQQILGNSAAPYINTLVTPGNANAAQSSYASNYTNVPGIHPSEPNYVWQVGGLAGPLNDADPYPNNIVNAPNFRGLLQNAGISWKSYQEDIDLARNGSGNLTSTVLPQNQWTVPLTRFSGTSADYTNPYNNSHQYDFAPKHEGSLFFTATNGGNDPTPSNPEAKHYAPLQQLQTDLTNNTMGKYNFITPDQFNDMHTPLASGFTYNGVHYTGDAASIAQGDNFLSIVVPMIMASQAYKNNGLIVIWNDETEGGDDASRTSMLITLSPLAKGDAFNSTLNYTHSSDLKSMQELFGVRGPNGSFLGDAGSAGTNDFSDLFRPGALSPVPEPSSVILSGLAIACLAGWRLRRPRSAA